MLITVWLITFASRTVMTFQLVPERREGDIQCQDFHGYNLQFLPPSVSILSITTLPTLCALLQLCSQPCSMTAFSFETKGNEITDEITFR